MPAAEVLTPPIAGGIGAGAPPAASQAAPEASPAKADSKPGQKPDATTQAAAKPGESKEDAEKGRWIPKSRFDEVIAKRDEATGKLQKLEEKGIYDEETADQILQQVEEYRDLTRAMREDPVEFVTRWSQEAPDSYANFYTAISQQGVQSYLGEQAKAYRAQGQTAEADFLEGLVQDHAGKRAQSATAPASHAAISQQGEMDPRWADFHEDVKAGAWSVLDRMINDLTAETQLSAEDKELLIDLIHNKVSATIEKDTDFRHRLLQFYDSRDGLNRHARIDAVKAYEKRLKVGGLVENEVKRLVSRFATSAAAASDSRTKIPDKAGQGREAAPGGPAAAGNVTLEDRASQKAAILADYNAGKISEPEKNARMLRLPRAS